MSNSNNNPLKHPATSSSTANNWLSSILRPRAASISVETCLNVTNADPAVALDARPVLPLLSSNQPLSTRLKHLKVFSELCESYKFTHLENVFFTIQDILEPTNMAREARHGVFEFMLACINGQYNELGMARITFYNSLRNYNTWDDFYDMYRVLYALCKGGRDISGFEKNISKLLINWLDVTLQHVAHYPHRLLLVSHGLHPSNNSNNDGERKLLMTSTTSSAVPSGEQHSGNTTDNTNLYSTMTMATASTSSTSAVTSTTTTRTKVKMIPYLSDILHLLTVIAKFNFALFEEGEVTHMVAATRQAFYASNHTDDITTCLAFCDVVVRYRFVPFGALKPFLEIICGAVTLPKDLLPDSSVSPWSIFLNLLRSHCAHNAILTLCNFLEEPLDPGSSAENLAEGAIILLTETAWGSDNHNNSSQHTGGGGSTGTPGGVGGGGGGSSAVPGGGGGDTYKVSDTVLLLYFLRALQQGGKNNGVIHACLLKSLIGLVANSENNDNIGLMDWDVIWDICDICTTFVLGMMDDDSQKQVLQNQLPDHHSGTRDIGGGGNDDEGGSGGGDLTYNAGHQLGRFLGRIYKLYLVKQYKGPVGRFMDVLYALRRYASESSATILLDYYEMEHYFLPSSENWIELLLDITNTFFLSSSNRTTTTTTSAIRSRVLSIVTDVCLAVKDFYSEEIYQRIVTPMMERMPEEKDQLIQQKAIDLLVECLLDCRDETIFDTMLNILKNCSQCRCSSSDHTTSEHHRNSATTPTHMHPSTSSSLRRSQSHTKAKPTQHHHDHTMPRSATANAAFGSISSLSTPSVHGQCMGVHGICGIVDLFEQLLRSNNKETCLKVYNIITQISQESRGLFCPFGGPKLIAMDLLLRLRCSPNHRIYVIEQVPVVEDNNYVLAIRNAYDLRKQNIRKQRENGPFGSSISRPSSCKERYGQSSPSILSYKERQGYEDSDEDEDDDDDDGAHRGGDNNNNNSDGNGNGENSEAVLNINNMIKAYISVLSESPNWEVVVFVLKRLPWQLATKHMFCGAKMCIRKLRRALVKWINSRNFLKQVALIPPTVKRNDLNVYAYELLTVLISYRRLFKKHAQDEMVYAFYIGITQVTAATKPCINALTICCHELPLSIAKMLNEILQRMSQIISVGSVSVHILEFLSGLARLPNLYSNFTGDMYKPVFAIALNYLQHARSVTSTGGTGYNTMGSQVSPASTPGLNGSPMFTHSATSSSLPSTPSASQQHQQSQLQQPKDTSQQGAMSQYVLIMAYLVITIWFTAIPLRERRKHVPFIIQRLLAGNPADEQTFTCIDMLSRFTFADVSLSPHKSLVSNILMDGPDDSTQSGQGKSAAGKNSRTWVYGHTLLTLKTAKALGWVEMTIRRPSGTVSMMCNIENNIKSDDIDYKTLPALLIMQYQPDLMAHRLLNEPDSRLEDITPDVSTMATTGMGNDGNSNDNTNGNRLVMEGEALGITFDEEDEDTADTNTKAGALSPSLLDHNKATTVLSSPTSPLSASSTSSHQLLDEVMNIYPKSPPQPPLYHSATAAVTSSASSSASSPLLLAGMRTPRLDKTKAAVAQEERIHTIVRDILSDQQGEHGVSQQSRNILRKMEPSLDPGFLYLQLNNYPDLTGSMETMPPLPDDEATARAIGNLDRIPVVDFHKIGVLYVAKGQHQEVEILANERGSPDYVKFLNSLGTIERLRGRAGNTGGLDREMDIDGSYAYFWKDDVTEMVFHVATMMPTHLDRDPRCSGKKRHIGNDFVTVVYFDDDDVASEYAFDTLPGQFNFINIVVTPYSMSTESVSPSRAAWGQENTFFKVTMQKRPDMPDMGPISESKLISAQSLPGFVRQVSLHANIFAQIFHRFGAGGKQEYVSHWRERLRHIRRIKDRIQQQQHSQLQQQQSTANPSTSVNPIGTPVASGTSAGSANTPATAAATTPNMNNASSATPNNFGILSAVAPNTTHNANSTTNTPTLVSLNSSKLHMENLFDFTRYT
ncbi:hypothetical protein BC941DRAFT_439377 [Chlamydoabsidia padenii]|nr:hypothetical protein BC941DRAFT_439377 [Chlamydoabsidia padenii]